MNPTKIELGVLKVTGWLLIDTGAFCLGQVWGAGGEAPLAYKYINCVLKTEPIIGLPQVTLGWRYKNRADLIFQICEG